MEKLINKISKLTPSEEKVFEFIYNNRAKVTNMKITDLARDSYSSKTVIINMCQKLGFEGFSDFKYYLKTQNKSEVEALGPKDSIATLEENIEKTFRLVDDKSYDRIAREIVNSGMVYIFARGTSKAAAYHLNHLLLTIGVKCIFVKDYNLLTLVSNTLKSNEIIVLISLSGMTEKILEAANIAKVKGAKRIAITSFENNELSRISDYALYCSSEDTKTKYNDSSSRIGMFIIIELLVADIKRVMEKSGRAVKSEE
ncbi:MAG: MurR/RpiR family transcriptional regulator [Clostridiaceae bacterium]